MTPKSLSELRDAMSGMEAPAEVKSAVMSEFIARRSKRRAPLAFWSTLAACLLLAAAGLYWGMTRSKTTAPVQQAALKKPEPPQPVLPSTPKPAVKRRLRRIARPRAETVQVARTTLDFFELPSAPPMDANDSGAIVRVKLPRSAMRSFGIAVDEIDSPGRVTADVVVGSDGVARAVRFVNLQTSEQR